MQDALGFLIFVVIVAVSIISKIKTEKKAAQDLEERQEPLTSIDELPEATRRMIYGDAEVIIAKPKRPTSGERPDVPVPARQVPYPTQQRPVPVAAPAPRPVQPPRPMRPQQQRPVQQPAPRRPAEQPQRSAPTQTTLRRPQPSRPATVRPAPAVPSREQSARPPRQAAQAQQQKLQKQFPRPRKGLAALLCSKNDLARGMVLRDILGPPRAFEDV